MMETRVGRANESHNAERGEARTGSQPSRTFFQTHKSHHLIWFQCATTLHMFKEESRKSLLVINGNFGPILKPAYVGEFKWNPFKNNWSASRKDWQAKWQIKSLPWGLIQLLLLAEISHCLGIFFELIINCFELLWNNKHKQGQIYSWFLEPKIDRPNSLA